MNASAAVSAKTDEVASTAQRRRERQPCGGATAPVARLTTTSAIATSVAGERYNAVTFAQQQLYALIQRVFFPGWPKAARQVVVSSADTHAESAAVCARIAREMAVGLPGTVCAVEADLHHPGVAESLTGSMPGVVGQEGDACIAVDGNLWLAQPCSLFDPKDEALDTVWLRTRLSDLRRNFDYTLIHAPAACLGQTIVLGQFADGLILVIQAGKTRRAVARTTLATLKAAKVAVLGTVLTDRTFPIPEKLYSRL